MRKQSSVRHPMSVAASLILLLLSTSSLAMAGDSINRAKLDFARENNIPLELLFMDREALTGEMQQRLALQYGVPLEFLAPDPAEGETTALSSAQARLVITPQAIAVSFLSPTSGGVSGGTQIFIQGFDFAPGATVTVGGVAATNVTVNECRFMRATTPPHAAGTVDVVVTNPDTQFATRVGGFTYVPITITVGEVRPNNGPVSGGTQVTISGSGFQTGISVFFGNSFATSVRVINSTTLTAVTPPGVEGLASLSVNQAGALGGFLTGGFLYTGINPPAPAITSITPSAAAPGSTVTIAGANFDGIRSVRFNNPRGFGEFASVVSVSPTQIMARVPAGAIAGPIAVETIYGTTRSCPFFTVMTAGPPTISGVPATAEEESFITITGTNFADVREVKFGSMQASFFFVSSATSIGAFPSVGALSGPISVVTSAGTATSPSVNITPRSLFCTGTAPTITGFTPTTGAPRTSVTLTGTGFKGFSITPGQGLTQVVFPGAPALFLSSASTTQLVVSVPPGAVSGPVRVITDYGSVTSTASFMVTPQPLPVVTSLSPDRGNADISVTMVSGVGGLESVTEVRFGGGLLSPNFFFSGGSLIARVPPGAITGPISLTTPSGTASSAVPFTVTCDPPTITSFTPVMGPAGTSVTINGTNFTRSSFFSDLAVTFNRIATSFSSPSSSGNSVFVSVPPAATTGRITVRTFHGTATSAADFTVTTATPPAITGFTPGSGAPGTSVIITGSNFHGATMVTFNGIDAGAFAFSNATTILANVPAGATSGPIRVVTPLGTATSLTNFTVTSSAPTIIGFFPRGGLPGTTITIAGTNFTGATAVTFNGVAATFTVNSSTVITATVPTGATNGPIAVTTPNGTATSATNFAVQAGPTVTGVQPSAGPRAGGTAVTITGTGFQPGATVLFGGLAASNVTVVNSTTITATTPPRSSQGAVSVTVTNPDGQSGALGSAFTYSDRPKGDANGDGAVTVGDIFYLINHLFAGGPSAIGPADANADGQVTVGDIFYLINFLFAGGPPPL